MILTAGSTAVATSVDQQKRMTSVWSKNYKGKYNTFASDNYTCSVYVDLSVVSTTEHSLLRFDFQFCTKRSTCLDFFSLSLFVVLFRWFQFHLIVKQMNKITE